MNEDIELDLIIPLHEVRNQRTLDDLVAGMKENGWQGRPLLIIEREADYVAWTGSHRLAAARIAGFAAVPCYVVQEGELIRHGFDAEWGSDDSDRLKAIRQTGDEDAIQIMWLEGRV